MDTTFRPRVILLCSLGLGLGGCVAPFADAQSVGVSSSSASAVTSITLERDCFGCATGSVLVLRRDGTAIHTLTGKSRHGTTDKVSMARVDTESFDTLARLAVAQGFFALQDRYEAEDLRDGAWTTTTISRGGQDKRVFRREDAGPPALRAIEAAIEGLKARTRFVP